MRTIHVSQIIETVAELCQEACYDLPKDVLNALEKASKSEKSPVGQSMLHKLLDNAQLATAEKMPYCHDTGMAVVYLEVGQEIHIEGGSLRDAVQEGVRRGYSDGYLRKSVVGDPVLRVNTGDNTPAVIHMDIVEGNELSLTVVPKGGGSENMSALEFLLPGDGFDGIKTFVLQTIKKAGGKACPPIVVGVGIGGTFDHVAYMAKKALLREIGVYNEQPHIAQYEKELLELINRTGIGPQGLGGSNTALWVAVESYGTHITALPVAVNLQCHAARRRSRTI